MAFFSKIFKGVKKVFKKIGRAIKKVAQGVGKFMDKIGIVGQIGLAFLLPGIGGLLSNSLGALGGWAAAGGSGWLMSGVKAVVSGAVKFASTAGRVFNTVSSGVKNFVGEFAKTAASKLGFNIEGASANFFGADGNFFGADGALGKALESTKDTWREGFGYKPLEEIGDAASGAAADTTEALVNEQLEEAGAGILEEEGILSPSATRPAPVGKADYVMDVNAQQFPGVQDRLDASVNLEGFDTGVDVPDLSLGEQETSLFGNIYNEVQERVQGMVDKPLTTAFNAFSGLSDGEEQEQYDYSYGTSGDIISAGVAPTIQPAAPVQMHNATFGYPQSQLDSIYRPSQAYNRFLGSLT